jgi:hypothetical protein
MNNWFMLNWNASLASVMELPGTDRNQSREHSLDIFSQQSSALESINFSNQNRFSDCHPKARSITDRRTKHRISTMHHSKTQPRRPNDLE